MQLKRRVALGGVQLDSLDNRILVTGIDEAAGKESISAVSMGYGSGQRITNQHRDTLDITVRFAMNIKNDDMAARSQLLDTVNNWARAGGWLTVGHRSGKQLNVVLAQAPGGGDQFNWGNDFTLVFRAYAVPYWEDVTATETTMEGDAGSMPFTVPGSAETVADFAITNTSGSTIDSIELSSAGNIIKFTDLGLANNATLTIDHIRTAGVYAMRARIGEDSVMIKKGGSDELILKPGSNSISWDADGDISMVVSAKGRYL